MTADKIAGQFSAVREECPLVHCITNYVTVNDVANAVLAIGASPIMADDINEAADIASIASALVINMGTLNQRTVDSMLAAAKAAQCDAFVSKLPEGYHTMIGENGSRLSGGERQRISIARAILKDAPVILLDEATASLDVENETAVQAALSGLIKDKTVLIIAHRMRTVMNADQIVLLSGGRVVEMGSPAELLKKNGLFRHMAQLQSESMEWTA